MPCSGFNFADRKIATGHYQFLNARPLAGANLVLTTLTRKCFKFGLALSRASRESSVVMTTGYQLDQEGPLYNRSRIFVALPPPGGMGKT